MPDKYDEYSREELLRLLRERDRKPRFGLVWERDEIEHDKRLNDDFVVLEPDAVLSVGEAPHQNLVIEGDNFDTLRYLRMAHAGKVKCIYIDPPYNTGNRAKLDLLLDSVFPGMRLGSFVWRNRQGSNADQDCFLSCDHEHVLVYGNPGFSFAGTTKTYEM